MQTRKWIVSFRKNYNPAENDYNISRVSSLKEIIVMAMSHEAAREIARDLLMEEIEFEYNQERNLPIYFIQKLGNDSIIASNIFLGQSTYEIMEVKEYN